MTRLNLRLLKPAGLVFLFSLIGLGFTSCGEEQEKSEGPIKKIHTQAQFQRVVEEAGDKLLVLDLYADWCMPCRMLSPILEEIAKTYKDRVGFYKIDIDNNPAVARQFNASSIPLVVFVRQEEGVHAMRGVQPREAYIDAIERNLRK